MIGGIGQKAHFFAPDLPHSDASYIRADPATTAEAWVDGHVHAFAFFGRMPLSVLYDNDRCLVARILPDGTRKRARLFSGLLSHYVIRDRYGDLLKLLWWDGQGLCRFAKRLERGRFLWPQARDGSVVLSSAQLPMLLEGIDWRAPRRRWAPGAAG